MKREVTKKVLTHGKLDIWTVGFAVTTWRLNAVSLAIQNFRKHNCDNVCKFYAMQ